MPKPTGTYQSLVKPKTKQPSSPLSITLYQAEEVTGQDAGTIKRNLMRNDYKVEPNKPIPLSVLFRLYTGAEQVEKIRNLKLDADQKERDAKRDDGKLCEWDAVLKLLNERFYAPLVAAMDAAPGGVDREWVEKVLKPAVRVKLEPPKKSK